MVSEHHHYCDHNVKQLHEALDWTSMLLLKALACALYDLSTKLPIS